MSSGNRRLTAGNCFSKPWVSRKIKPFVSAEGQRASRRAGRAPTKKQFGRKNYYIHALLAQSMGHPARSRKGVRFESEFARLHVGLVPILDEPFLPAEVVNVNGVAAGVK